MFRKFTRAFALMLALAGLAACETPGTHITHMGYQILEDGSKVEYIKAEDREETGGAFMMMESFKTPPGGKTELQASHSVYDKGAVRGTVESLTQGAVAGFFVGKGLSKQGAPSASATADDCSGGDSDSGVAGDGGSC